MANNERLKTSLLQRDSIFKRLEALKRVADAADQSTSQQIEFKLRYAKIQSLYDGFFKHHNIVLTQLSLGEDDNLDSHHTICEQFESMFYGIQGVYANYDASIIAPNQSNNNNQTQLNTSALDATSHIKLPRVELPRFGGNITEWATYFQLYKALIHDQNISNIEKFNYMRSSLSNQPLNLIAQIPMTNDNYLIAFNILKKRYEHPRLIATAHWRNIENSPKLNENTATPENIRSIVNTFSENISALQALHFPTQAWSFPLFQMLLNRLDSATKTRFELEQDNDTTTVPEYNTLVEFLNKYCTAQEVVAFSDTSGVKKNPQGVKLTPQNNNFSQKPRFSNSYVGIASPNAPANTSSSPANPSGAFANRCSLCQQPHLIYRCPQFTEKTPRQRFDCIKSHKFCTNCLSSMHTLTSCRSESVCRFCAKRHHSLLHFIEPTTNAPSPHNRESEQNASNPRHTFIVSSAPPASISANASRSAIASASVLLATAQAQILDSQNKYQNLRVLLDSASQCNIMSQACATRLGLKPKETSLSIRGLGNSGVTAEVQVNCCLRPIDGDNLSTLTFDAVILPQICTALPSSFVKADWPHIANLKLADRDFCTPGEIDLLVGAEIFPQLLLEGRIRGSKNEPVAINTIFGFVLMGKIDNTTNSHVNSFFTLSNALTIDNALNATLKSFWEVEEVPKSSTLSPEDKKCEEIFQSSLSRDASGRYIVTLPFKNSEPQFTNTRLPALKRFFGLERKLNANPDLRKQYCDFMREYWEEGHMCEIKNTNLNFNDNAYYIPHHAVVGAKLRVVFDASFAPAPKPSLNDTLLTGPKLQQDLLRILLKFRLHSIVFTTDIQRMYRQILVAPQHQDFQRIIWRFSPDENIKIFRLLTVTYGVNSSPYLAIRTMLQLASDEGRDFPQAAKVVEEDMYVDDIVTGSSSVAKALALQTELIQLMERGQFKLRKWTSNHPDLLSHLPADHIQGDCIDFDQDSTVKILGLQWSPRADAFLYKVEPHSSTCTKRTILSEIARIFDITGFLCPVIITAKYLIQYLWTIGLSWDSTPPPEVVDKWKRFKTELPLLKDISIPRFIPLVDSNILYSELHGFADASEKAYAAAIYARIIFNENDIRTFLICAKSRVAPLKRLSIPRLELNAAVLLADLIDFVKNTYDNKIVFKNIFAWSDSQVVLAWIRSPSHKWLTYVSHRTSYIHSKINPECFKYVSTDCNPADCASRGLMPSELSAHPLWWEGPAWLKQPESLWPGGTPPSTELPEITAESRKIVLAATVVETNYFSALLDKFSSLNTAKRIVAYCQRFIHNMRHPTAKITGFLTASELYDATIVFVKQIQITHFSSEIAALTQKRPLSKVFRKLNIFLDANNLVRVGGRLRHSNLKYEQKHPILLPSKDRFVDLLIIETHKKYLHGGIQTTQYLVAQNYWILSSKRVIRKLLSRCVQCWKLVPTSPQPPMGDLPPLRVSQLRAFKVVGTDYGGPFSILMSRHRGSKRLKAYIALFVCFSTRALHLELASDLSTEAFLAALRRFIGRRGRCSKLYSDCGTQYVGANRQIQEMFANAAEIEQIEWSFNPPGAPHFGGLWEAGIKSVKTHLARVIGEQVLTYEEFNTVLVQIEAVLNSRPLCPMSSDANDMRAISPGLFLTLEPLSCIPEPDLNAVPLNRLSRWQLLTRLHADFWRRFRTEYMHTLSQRAKWTDLAESIKVGTLVLLKNELTPPLRWPLGRVIEVHPGADGIVRVVTVRTTSGIFKRPVVKVCPLPIVD